MRSLNLQIQNNKICLQNYTNVTFISTGSFVTCFSALNKKQEKVAIIVTDNLKEVQTRLSLSQRLSDVSGVQKYTECCQLITNPKDLVIINQHLSQVYSSNLYALIGPFYSMQFNEYTKQLNVQQKIDLFYDILVIVMELHSMGIYHMDLKPSNIMIQNGKPILIDFGQAVCDIQVDSVLNTSAYSPKHDVYSCKVIPEKFDVYCLGNILHELYTHYTLGAPVSYSKELCSKLESVVGILAGDLIIGMTKYKQDCRYSIEQCVSHPIFNSSVQDRSAIEAFHSQINYKEEQGLRVNTYSRDFSYTNLNRLTQDGSFTKLAFTDFDGVEVFSRVNSCALFFEPSYQDELDY
ncbi:Kinase [Hexamita inflata]|uniref:CAMK CAMKL n=1 Tax=Hexamita inflata TaxID=28002 RepID=A0AA86U2J5_9EUKA|nr:CAMK CAMKL [Hexamita inflata]